MALRAGCWLRRPIAVRLAAASLPTTRLQQQGERQQLQQRAEAAEAALEKQRAATAELRNVLDALRCDGTRQCPAGDGPCAFNHAALPAESEELGLDIAQDGSCGARTGSSQPAPVARLLPFSTLPSAGPRQAPLRRSASCCASSWSWSAQPQQTRGRRWAAGARREQGRTAPGPHYVGLSARGAHEARGALGSTAQYRINEPRAPLMRWRPAGHAAAYGASAEGCHRGRSARRAAARVGRRRAHSQPASTGLQAARVCYHSSPHG